MKAKPFLILLFGLLISLSVVGNAQTKGRKVPVTKKTITGQKGTLSIEAGLVFKSGDVKPVARVDFYLLDQNLETILEGADIKKSPQDPILRDYAFSKKMERKGDIYLVAVQKNLEKAETAIKPHIIATIKTDFNGKAEFSDVKPGKYYLVGVGGTDQAVVWNMPIEIKAGKQSITLDQENSAVIY